MMHFAGFLLLRYMIRAVSGVFICPLGYNVKILKPNPTECIRHGYERI